MIKQNYILKISLWTLGYMGIFASISAQTTNAVQALSTQQLNAEVQLVSLRGVLEGFDTEITQRLNTLNTRRSQFDTCASEPALFNGVNCVLPEGVSTETTLYHSCGHNLIEACITYGQVIVGYTNGGGGGGGGPTGGEGSGSGCSGGGGNSGGGGGFGGFGGGGEGGGFGGGGGGGGGEGGFGLGFGGGGEGGGSGGCDQGEPIYATQCIEIERSINCSTISQTQLPTLFHNEESHNGCNNNQLFGNSHDTRYFGFCTVNQ